MDRKFEERLTDYYSEIWSDFVTAHIEFEKKLVDLARENFSLHELCRRLYAVPYEFGHRFLDSVPIMKNTNIGSVTGFFFQHLVSSIISNVVREKIESIWIEANACRDQAVKAIARDPDLFLKCNDHKAVIEFKVSPKKADVRYILSLKDKYNNIGVEYYFIGGHISMSSEELHNLSGCKWMTFLSSSNRNIKILSGFSTVDSIVESLLLFLNEGRRHGG